MAVEPELAAFARQERGAWQCGCVNHRVGADAALELVGKVKAPF